MSRPRIEPYHCEDYELWVFGAKTCPVCGETFAANTDYFAPDKENADGLTGVCRNCRRERDRRRNQRPGVRERKRALARDRYRRMKAADHA